MVVKRNDWLVLSPQTRIIKLIKQCEGTYRVCILRLSRN
uniref:Uncharacterized protein n=1 Tax=Rhizophora mucronata TaxID=61149 RepID=A0A2P2KCT3_RHIMU